MTYSASIVFSHDTTDLNCNSDSPFTGYLKNYYVVNIILKNSFSCQQCT